jgi:magnesium transporter
MQWHDVRDPNSPELDRLAEQYGLHPLHVEDSRHRNESAKLEETPNYLFAVLKPVRMNEEGDIEVTDLDLFLGRDFLITVEEGRCPEMVDILDKVRSASNGSRADQLFYKLTDAVVDLYLPTLDRLDDVIDELEEAVLERPTPEALSRIFETKRSLITLRRVLVNTRDVATHLQRSESPFIGRDMWPFLRDIYDHVARNLDIVEMQRDLLSGTLDVYLSSVANRTNQVMKVLTVVGTIALPALVISGIYGMNVKGLPFAESRHAAPLISATIAVGMGILLAILRYFHWF